MSRSLSLSDIHLYIGVMKVLLFQVVVVLSLGLWDMPWETDHRAAQLPRLHLPSKHTETIFTFRATYKSTSMNTQLNIPFILLIPKTLLSLSYFSMDSRNEQCCSPPKNFKQRYLIMLWLLMSGINPNPGPAENIATPLEFSNRLGLGIVHLNVRSLLPKLDQVQIWAKTTKADILVISETWLKK